MAKPVYRRVVVKVSGEALMGPDNFGIHQPTLEAIAADLVATHALGVAVAVVAGGGNIFRGVKVSAHRAFGGDGAISTQFPNSRREQNSVTQNACSRLCLLILPSLAEIPRRRKLIPRRQIWSFAPGLGAERKAELACHIEREMVQPLSLPARSPNLKDYASHCTSCALSNVTSLATPRSESLWPRALFGRLSAEA